MRCCADDPRTLFSAARAHSRLHRAAVLAASSFTAELKNDQVHGMLAYLAKYGQRISSVALSGADYFRAETPAILNQLPHDKLQKLESLALEELILQLQPRRGYKGVLQAGASLKKVQIHECQLLSSLAPDDEEKVLAAALLLLPQLEHLSINHLCTASQGAYGTFGAYSVFGGFGFGASFKFPGDVIKAMRQLTHLELSNCGLQNGMQHLKGLTGLQDLRLCSVVKLSVTASILSGCQRLTRLEVSGVNVGQFYMNPGALSRGDNMGCSFEPAALSGKTQLRHLALGVCRIAGGSAGVVHLLSSLQPLQQLTHVEFDGSLQAVAPATAYSVLTASSQLQYLEVWSCILPAGVWQHVFPAHAGRQLPQLREIDFTCLHHPDDLEAKIPAPEGGLFAACCPKLQSLRLVDVVYSPMLFLPLMALSSLQKLHVSGVDVATNALDWVCGLKQLKDLCLMDYFPPATVPATKLLLLTELSQLTKLDYMGSVGSVKLQCKVCDTLVPQAYWSKAMPPKVDLISNFKGHLLAAWASCT
jgi:hypothetical protein